MSPQRPPAPRPGRAGGGSGRPVPPRRGAPGRRAPEDDTRCEPAADPAPSGGRPRRPAAPRSAPTPAAPRSAPTPAVRDGDRPRPLRVARSPRTGPTPVAAPGPGRDGSSGDRATDVTTRAVTTYTVSRFAGPVRPAVVSTTSRERFEERARARRNLARRQVLAWAGGTVAVGALGWLLLLSPVLALDPDQVEVTGAGTVVAVDQVLDVVAQRAGTPLPRLDTVGLRDSVLEVPGVREARVVRQWPHGVGVQLVSREPVAAVPDPADGGLVLLDEQGVQVGRADAAPQGLPVVDVPVGDERTLSSVLQVLEQLPEDLLVEIESVAARTQDTVTMQLRDGGARVDWGSADETALKVAVLRALRAAPSAAGATVFDVSAPRMPITR